MFISNATASFGNLIAEDNGEKRFKVFKEMDFIAYALYGVSMVCLLFTFNPFIEFVFGSKFVLPFTVVMLIMINYYLVGLNQVPIIVQSAAGVYKYDKYVPLIEAAVNVVASVILVQFMGLSGILIGTLISYCLPLVIKPFVVFKYVLFKDIKLYFKSFGKQILTLIAACLISGILISFIHVSLILQIVINFLISFIVPVLVIIIVYRNTDEFLSFKDRFKFLFDKIRKRA